MDAIKTAENYFHLVFQIYHFAARFLDFSLSILCMLYCLAKQRIDSGFFLFQAEQKKKAEKKNSKKVLKTKNCMQSSDDDFM